MIPKQDCQTKFLQFKIRDSIPRFNLYRLAFFNPEIPGLKKKSGIAIPSYHRDPRPRFPKRRENYSDSCTFKADIGLLIIFAWVFRTSAYNGGFGGKIGEGVVRHWPSTNSIVLTFRGSYVCANFGENRSRNATVRVLADGQTQPDRQTDANWFYNLSHAISLCYSYGTDNNQS